MAKALKLTGGKEVEETVKFITKFDQFFDCFNVRLFSEGRLQRKVFKQLYHSGTDYRLKVQSINTYKMYIHVHVL